MSNLKSNTEWSDVYQLEKNDPALAGPGGVMNKQAQSLLNRTEYLKTNKADNAALVAEVNRSKGVEENLQRQITTSTAGIKYFNTLAQLTAFTPSEADPKQAYVFATKKNYIWDGDWQDEGLSVLDEAKKYVDESIDLFDSSFNIFDKTDAQVGAYWNWQDGTLRSTANTFAASKLLNVEPNTEYQVPQFYTQQHVILDENKIYVSGKASVAADNFKITTPSNAKYICMTVETAQLDKMMLCKTAEYPSTYIPYAVKLKKLIVEPEQIQDLDRNIKSAVNISDLNIIDNSKLISDHYISYQDGELKAISGMSATDFIEVQPNTLFCTDSLDQQHAFYNDKKKFIFGVATIASDRKFTTPAEAKYVRFTIRNYQIPTAMVTEDSVFPSSYQPYAVKIAKNLVIASEGIKTTEIWVSADLNDTDLKVKFKGKNAIQLALNSITDATAKNRYTIQVKKGLYKINKASDFIGYLGYPSMIVPKDHVDIVGRGEGNTIVWAELPYKDDDIGPSADGNTYGRILYQTVYDYADDCLIKDITFVSKNLRYTNHIDDARGVNKTHKYENVSHIFKGNIGSMRAFGTGTHSGEKIYIKGGTSHSDMHLPYSCHNNTAFEEPSLWSYVDHHFSSVDGKIAIYKQNNGSLVQDTFELIGCSFGGSVYRIDYEDEWLRANTANNYDSFNHAEWRFTGYGNEPFLFRNNVLGYCLRFKSNSTGVASQIRFDTESSAFPVLIKNNQINSDASIYTDGRECVDGYIVQDGYIDMSAYAFGCKDLTEAAAAYDAGVNYTSLAKRLGDCSAVNKVLKIIVNETLNTITFNKNYSSMANAKIISEMNAQLSNATVDLYRYGRDYYPMMSDVAETAYNNGITFIHKGSLVTKVQGKVKLANDTDKIFGVALDDIPVFFTKSDGEKRGQGRVLKRGYIYTDRQEAHYVLSDNQNPAIGTRFSVKNGQLITDANGKISVDIDAGVVSINC